MLCSSAYRRSWVGEEVSFEAWVEGTAREVKRRVRVVASSYRAIDRSVTWWIVVQVKLWNPSTTRAIPERFCSEVSPPSLSGTVSSVWRQGSLCSSAYRRSWAGSEQTVSVMDARPQQLFRNLPELEIRPESANCIRVRNSRPEYSARTSVGCGCEYSTMFFVQLFDVIVHRDDWLSASSTATKRRRDVNWESDAAAGISVTVRINWPLCGLRRGQVVVND